LQSLNRNPLTNENSGGNLFGFITGWKFTGYQGRSHGAAISLLWSQCIISVKIYYKTVALDLDRGDCGFS
jgi:hypothetical protein